MQTCGIYGSVTTTANSLDGRLRTKRQKPNSASQSPVQQVPQAAQAHMDLFKKFIMGIPGIDPLPDDFPLLHYALLHIKDKDIENIKNLLNFNIGINVTDSSGQTVLHLAANRGKIQTMALLLEKGVDINAKDNDKETPLHIAVKQNNVNAVELLIEAGAKLDVKNDSHCLPRDLIISLTPIYNILEKAEKAEGAQQLIVAAEIKHAGQILREMAHKQLVSPAPAQLPVAHKLAEGQVLYVRYSDNYYYPAKIVKIAPELQRRKNVPKITYQFFDDGQNRITNQERFDYRLSYHPDPKAQALQINRSNLEKIKKAYEGILLDIEAQNLLNEALERHLK